MIPVAAVTVLLLMSMSTARVVWTLAAVAILTVFTLTLNFSVMQNGFTAGCMIFAALVGVVSWHSKQTEVRQ